MHITASSTISHQPTFQNKGFSLELKELKPNSKLITPDYNAFIPAMERRRMSDVLKMSIACTIECLEQAELSQPDAIIVGTSMGCCIHTKIFLDKIIAAEEGPLSPTSFIVSTHNTIAGQISLLLKNHGYNITHTQNSLSFEQALIDGMLCIKDGYRNVLVGGADEQEEAIYNMKERLKAEKLELSSGASFFILSDEFCIGATVNLIDVGSFGLVDDMTQAINQFFYLNRILIEDVDLVLYCSSDKKKTGELQTIFEHTKMFDYQKITGTYYTNSAFALSYAIDILSHKTHSVFGNNIKNILVCNNMIPENLGLILLNG